MNLTLIAAAICAALAGVSGFGAAWRLQAANINEIKLEQANERIAVQRAARAAIERSMSAVSQAQAKAADRVVRLAADSARATSALDSLRTASASALRSAAGDIEACTRSLSAHSQLLGQCGQELVRVAGEADSWASHAVSLQDAWHK